MAITQWTAASVHRAILSACGVDLSIKPVNDLLYDGKKVCGILTELTGTDLIIGVGINADTNLLAFSEELRNTVLTLRDITGTPTDLAALRNAVLLELSSQFRDFPENSWRMEYYRAHLCSPTGSDAGFI